MRSDGLPLLLRLGSPGEFADYVGDVHSNQDDPYRLEAVAYALILSRRYAEAGRVFRRFRQVAARSEQDWMREVDARVRRVETTLDRDPTEAVTQLSQWRDSTATALKLVSG